MARDPDLPSDLPVRTRVTLVRIATAGDPLALAQAGWVSVRLGAQDLRSELVVEGGGVDAVREAGLLSLIHI